MGETDKETRHCRGSQCLFQDDKDGLTQIRCSLCCISYHINCVSIKRKDSNTFWTCFDCRDVAPNVKALKEEIKQLNNNQNEMLTLLKQLTEKLTNESTQRMKVEEELTGAKTQLAKLSEQLTTHMSRMTEQTKAPPPVPSQATPSAPPMPRLLIGTSLLRNVDPKKLENWEVIAKGGAKIDDLLKELNGLPDNKIYSDIVVVGGSIDVESKDTKEIIADFQALKVIASEKSEKLIISSILPRSDKIMVTKTKELNEELRKLCLNEEMIFVDNDPTFHLMNGNVNNACLVNDGLHLSKYGIDSLLVNCGVIKNGSAFTPTKYSKSQTMDSLRFKGHKHPLSNFFPVKMKFQNKQFGSTEAAYQYMKAEAMNDHYAASKIMTAPTALHAMRIGDKIVTNEQWQQKKAKVMEAILIEKLKTCNKTKKILMESGTQHIVEDTGHEFWGRGKSETGKNVLGKIWMDLREKIRTDSKFLERPRSFDHTHIKRHAWATRNDQPRCYQCGETGHIWRTCRKQEPVICWTCNTEGHKQKHCTYFSRQSRNYSWY